MTKKSESKKIELESFQSNEGSFRGIKSISFLNGIVMIHTENRAYGFFTKEKSN